MNWAQKQEMAMQKKDEKLQKQCIDTMLRHYLLYPNKIPTEEDKAKPADKKEKQEVDKVSPSKLAKPVEKISPS